MILILLTYLYQLSYSFIIYKHKGYEMFENLNSYAESLRKQHGTPLLNKAKTAKELSISRATLDRMRKDGQIKSKKIGQQIRFHVTEIASIVMSGVK